MIRGAIRGISGPTASVDIAGVGLHDRVYVGRAMLTGEVVRLEKGRAIVQIYEDTKGLGIGEPVLGTGMPLTARLGPGLVSGMFDGLQRPIDRLREDMGPFIRRSKEIYAIDYNRKWRFFPLKNRGDEVRKWDVLGYMQEGAVKHLITSRLAGRLAWLAEGDISLNDAVAMLDKGREIFACHEWPVRAPRPYARRLPLAEPVVTGQRCIDFLFPMAKGGSVILPGGFGTGKTILEQAIAKFADADVVVYVGCGERGNEMAELIDEFRTLSDPRRGKGLMERTILVANTSNMPVAAREASIYTAVTMAEYYRDMGCHVLFLADSLSRWAEALREISSSLEEMPGEEGYPTYLASRLSAFFARAGIVETMSGGIGSLSMVLSVSPAGGDFTEPVTQACLRAAGAFLMLDTSLAHRRHFPAINYFQSYSLYEKDTSAFFNKLFSNRWDELRLRCREILQKEQAIREVVEIIGIEGLQDSDRLLMSAAERIRTEFLSQNAYTDDAFSTPEKTFYAIAAILEFYEKASKKLKAGCALEDALKT